jgi:hypothetical protein
MDLADIALSVLGGICADRVARKKSKKYKEVAENVEEKIVDTASDTANYIVDMLKNRKYVIAGKNFIKSLDEEKQKQINKELKDFKAHMGYKAKDKYLQLLGRESLSGSSTSQTIFNAGLKMQEALIKEHSEGLKEEELNEILKSARNDYKAFMTS